MVCIGTYNYCFSYCICVEVYVCHRGKMWSETIVSVAKPILSSLAGAYMSVCLSLNRICQHNCIFWSHRSCDDVERRFVNVFKNSPMMFQLK